MTDHPPGKATHQADFEIVGETGDFLAVNKPAGLLVHPTKPDGTRTLWDGLRELLGYELANGGQISLINRLDRETSGIVLVAKSREAARRAGMAMEARQIGKVYWAVVFGWPESDSFEIREPILRKGEVLASEVHLERMVHPRGDAAETGFRILHRGEDPSRGRFSIVEARPRTGRTHQIRVHLAFAGHPVLGDKLYAKGSALYLEFIRTGWTPRLKDELWTERHALHCHRMELEALSWHCGAPQDLRDFFPKDFQPAV